MAVEADLLDSGPKQRPSPLEVLRTVFGFDAFRGEQQAIIDHVVEGGNALVLMPTGGGKSLCYQVPALCRPGLGVIVSPLIALMQNQVDALRQRGVCAAALNSSLHPHDIAATERAVREGELDFLYVAPERLLMPGMLDLLDRTEIALFAIDEAHCVSQWGHDFRPEYRQLALLGERFPAVSRIALTATADAETRRDIVERLGLQSGRVFVSGFDRPNITYRVLPRINPRSQLLQFLRAEHAEDAGIVYCFTRSRVDDTARWLADEGFAALPYHAGLDRDVRAVNQDRFLKEDGVVMVATIAFGMGIDKPDVRFVAHLELPKSLEAYYQETGRAGRDGLPADAWMLYGLKDAATLRGLIEASDAPEKQKHVERQKLNALLGYCETTGCRRQALLAYFGETDTAACGNCDTCLQPVESFDGTEAAQKLLSCIYRTGERFGAAHVIRVLRGSGDDRIRRLGHDRLSTYGIGAGLSRAAWHSVLRQLVAAGLVVIDVAGHGGLRLGADCRPVLRGERRISLRRDIDRPDPVRSSSRAAPEKAVDLRDQPLFKAIRDLRRRLAQVQGVPPYVIFHDSTLLAIAREKPRDLLAFGQLPGVGKAKLERYAADFLAVVAEHGEPCEG
jgi:ATP-dependent DNA helicase RecQ